MRGEERAPSNPWWAERAVNDDIPLAYKRFAKFLNSCWQHMDSVSRIGMWRVFVASMSERARWVFIHSIAETPESDCWQLISDLAKLGFIGSGWGKTDIMGTLPFILAISRRVGALELAFGLLVSPSAVWWRIKRLMFGVRTPVPERAHPKDSWSEDGHEGCVAEWEAMPESYRTVSVSFERPSRR